MNTSPAESQRLRTHFTAHSADAIAEPTRRYAPDDALVGILAQGYAEAVRDHR